MKRIGLIALTLPLWMLAPGVHATELGQPLDSRADAIEMANTITGLNTLLDTSQSPPPEICAVPAPFVDSTTPFLADSLDGRAAWHVTYPTISLPSDDTFLWEQRPKPQWQAEVWLDSLTGKLLQVYFRNRVADPVPYRLPSAAEAQSDLTMFREKYHGLPDNIPVTSMLFALGRDKGRASVAPEIIVQYVMYSRLGSEPVPAWVIYLRFPPSRELSRDPKETFSETRRFIVNAISGKLFPICTIRSPYVE